MTRSRFYALLERFGTPEQVFAAQASEITSIRGLDHAAAQNILDSPRSCAAVERELELIERHQVRLLTVADPDYPENLRISSFPPPLLYIRGDLRGADRYSIALVGSRNSTTYGRAVAQEFAARFAAYGMTVVSGFARGVDAAAHQGALAQKGRTLAVLGNGLAVCYPSEHRALAERIAGGGGALISEYPMETPPDRYNFPERNRIIATLSLGTVVVEAAERSGALITAREALEENRFVFAVPGDVTRLNSRGANNLIQSGARLVQRPADALSEMKHVLAGYLREDAFENVTAEQTPPRSARRAGAGVPRPELQPPAPCEAEAGRQPAPQATVAQLETASTSSLTEDETLVLDLIRFEPRYFDALAAQVDPARLPVPRLSAVLLSLELKRAIRQLPGRLYAVLDA